MLCTTVRKGQECIFMKAKGCSYTGGICREIIEKCKGCNRTIEFESGWYCSVAPNPEAKWKLGNCNMATHIAVEQVEQKAKVNPLKASKRAARG